MFSTLRQLHEGGVTGILRLRGEGSTDVDIYFMDGTIISAATLADDWVLARLLTAGGALPGDILGPLVEAVETMPLPDALLDQQLVPVQVVQAAQGECFHENMALACATPWNSADFCPEDIVFPPNMQLGVPTSQLLDELAGWFQQVEPLLAIIRRPCDPVLRQTGEPLPGGEPEHTVASLCDEPTTYSELLTRSLWVPFRSQLALAHLISSRVLSIEIEPEEGGDPEPVTGELPSVDTSLASEDSEAILSAANIEPLSESYDDEPPFPRGEQLGRDADGRIDYEHVEAGGHAKVYEVLDKVDLSHVDAFPGHEELLGHAADHDELIVAAAEESFEVDGGEAIETEPSSDDDEDMKIVIESADSDSNHDPDSHFEAPPIHLSGTEEAFELSVDEEVSDPGPAKVAEVHGEIPQELAPDLGFSSDEVRAFDRRIQVFNQIFRVIFEAFRTVLGDEAVRERFNRFLQDESLQYPNLFKGLEIELDGTLRPAPLIQNLADDDPLDADSFLHQGLYELIYVHLYDAKDVLTPEDEQTMMDQIAAHEEQLHQ